MRKLITLIITIACTLSVSAQKTISFEGADEVVRLWDNSTAKHSNHETRDEKWHKENVSYCQTSSCELYIFKAAADKNTGVAIAMFPGGSYRNGNLSVSLAKWYASQGITAALVKYRLPNYGHNKATLEDAEGAVRYLRTRTDLGINPAKVGVQGSSAGGHLASWVSNAMSDGEKPAFAILHYPGKEPFECRGERTPPTSRKAIHLQRCTQFVNIHYGYIDHPTNALVPVSR